MRRQFGAQADIRRIAVARRVGRIDGQVAGQRRRAATLPGSRFARAALLRFMRILETDAEVGRFAQAQRHGTAQVGVGGRAAVALVADVKIGLATRIGQRVIGRVLHAHVDIVAAVGAADIPAPARRLALDATRQGKVVFARRFIRREAVGIHGQQAFVVIENGIGQTEILRRAGIAVGIRAEAVQLHLVRHVIADVRAERGSRALRHARIAPWIAVAVRFGRVRRSADGQAVVRSQFDQLAIAVAHGRIRQIAGIQAEIAHGDALALDFGAEVGKAVFAQTRAAIDARGTVRAVAIVGGTELRAEAALVIGFQDDVDDAGDGVGAVDGRGAVAQDFHAGNGPRGDQGQVGGDGTGKAIFIDDGRRMPAFAVDQHQRMRRVEVAQLPGAHDAAQVGLHAGRQVKRWQGRVQRIEQVQLACSLQLLRADHVDGRGAVGHRAARAARARDDDGVERASAIQGGLRMRQAGRCQRQYGHRDGVCQLPQAWCGVVLVNQFQHTKTSFQSRQHSGCRLKDGQTNKNEWFRI